VPVAPRFFHACPERRDDRLIVAIMRIMLRNGMVLDQTSTAAGLNRVIIDDRSRLPGRFFGRFATSATSELTRAL
jgi:hypothetical protein